MEYGFFPGGKVVCIKQGRWTEEQSGRVVKDQRTLPGFGTPATVTHVMRHEGRRYLSLAEFPRRKFNAAQFCPAQEAADVVARMGLL